MSRPDANAAASIERFFQFSLLGLVASGYLAVAGSGYLDVPTIVLTAAGLLLRGLLVWGIVRLAFSDRALTAATLGYIVFFALDYFLLSRDFLSATVHLVFFLAVMKILTSRTNRDYLYTAVIAFVELLAAAILSINLNFFLFLALYLAFAIAALTSGEIRRSFNRATATARNGHKSIHPRLALTSGFVTFGILLLTAGLFFFLPRTADATLARLVSHRIHLPGFSNRVSLDEIGEIKASSRPVMHIRLYSPDQPVGIKWRGGALTEFDGKRWLNLRPEAVAIDAGRGHINLVSPADRRNGRRISYQIELDGLDTDALFFAGTPEQVDLKDTGILRTVNGSFRLGHQPPQGFRYEAYSLLEDVPETALPGSPAPALSASERSQNLETPPLDPRIPQLARSLTLGRTTDLERARAIERHLRRDYGYTLELPSREVADPLANFLFTRKKGHCEYFASAMAILLRSIGIPARMATGFQTGVYNPLTELWLVRASDAHAWVEAWMPGHGWTTFDPTPPDPRPATFTLASKLALYIDAADTFWKEWVVSYDAGHQGTLADKLEQGAGRLGIRWFDSLSGAESRWDGVFLAWLRRYGVQTAAVLALGFFIWLFGPYVIRMLRIRMRVERVRRGAASVADATLLYERMLHLLKRQGYQKPPWFTPAEFAASLPQTDLRVSVTEFTRTYNALRFGGRTDVAPRLSMLLDDLERQGRHS